MRIPMIVVLGLLALGCGKGSPLAPSPLPVSPVSPVSPSRYDVLDYIVGESSTWPRTGDQQQDQYVDWAARRICWVKYARAEMFECWRWDEQFVYHEVDHGLDGELAGQSYRFTDGRWLPRYLDGEHWQLDLPQNAQVWYTRGCMVDGARSYRFPYRMAATLAGDELTLTYEPYNPTGGPTYPELFSFHKGRGWYRWERSPYVRVFDTPGVAKVQPALGIVCS